MYEYMFDFAREFMNFDVDGLEQSKPDESPSTTIKNGELLSTMPTVYRLLGETWKCRQLAYLTSLTDDESNGKLMLGNSSLVAFVCSENIGLTASDEVSVDVERRKTVG